MVEGVVCAFQYSKASTRDTGSGLMNRHAASSTTRASKYTHRVFERHWGKLASIDSLNSEKALHC